MSSYTRVNFTLATLVVLFPILVGCFVDYMGSCVGYGLGARVALFVVASFIAEGWVQMLLSPCED
jgi:hypothetical protein